MLSAHMDTDNCVHTYHKCATYMLLARMDTAVILLTSRLHTSISQVCHLHATCTYGYCSYTAHKLIAYIHITSVVLVILLTEAGTHPPRELHFYLAHQLTSARLNALAPINYYAIIISTLNNNVLCFLSLTGRGALDSSVICLIESKHLSINVLRWPR